MVEGTFSDRIMDCSHAAKILFYIFITLYGKAQSIIHLNLKVSTTATCKKYN